MTRPDWLVVLGADGCVIAVDGGAPRTWMGRPFEGCEAVPASVRTQAVRLVRTLRESHGGAVRSVVLAEEDGPTYSLVVLEAMSVRPVEIEVGALVREALSPMFSQAVDAHVTLTLTTTEDLGIRALVDADKLVWAVSSLVGAAIRHSRRKESKQQGHVLVEIHADRVHHMVAIHVRDDGPGIPADVRPWLLEQHPDTGRSSGPALKMIRDMVLAHGGGMIIKDHEPDGAVGSGTVVTLRLPMV